MQLLFLLLGIYSVLYSPFLWSNPSCLRTATISGQMILVDEGSARNAEGLEHYLKHDKKSYQILKKYKESKLPDGLVAAVGTLGTGLILTGLLSGKRENDSESIDRRDILLGAGVLTLFLNFLIAKSYTYKSESHLKDAVEEYNKRNRPQIFLGPFQTQAMEGKSNKNLGAIAGIGFNY